MMDDGNRQLCQALSLKHSLHSLLSTVANIDNENTRNEHECQYWRSQSNFLIVFKLFVILISKEMSYFFLQPMGNFTAQICCLEDTGVNLTNYYRLIPAYLLLGVNYDKIMHASWDFDVLSARTRRVSAFDKYQNWSPIALFFHNSQA